MPLSAGSRLGPYEIVATLGSGGMGEVYRARDARLGREVALKVLPERFAHDPDALARFRREASSASALNHPHIVAIHDVGSHRQADGSEIHYFTMELIDGGTLRDRMGRDPIKKLLGYVTQVADGLAKAHAAGILHRDLKPENIMVAADGYAKLVDFGLAKSVRELLRVENETPTERHQTAPGTVVGTVSYMSPEQVQGKDLDARSDIFSLGCILYEIATGKRPFDAHVKIDTMHAIVHSEPGRIAEWNLAAPSGLQRVADRCLAKDPDDRYQSVKEVSIELRDLFRQLESGGTARPARSKRRFTAGGRWAIALLIMAILSAVIAMTVHFTRFSGPSTREPQVNSLAILPFVNGAKDPAADYLSDGITDEIINSLSQLPGLRVLARSTVLRFKGRDVDPRSLGRELGVDAIVLGELREIRDLISVKVELVRTRDGALIWGGQYNRKMTDLLAIQEEITRDISERVRRKLTGEDEKRLSKRPTANPAAYRLYLQGRYYAEKFTKDEVKKGIDYFHQALDLDPNYAEAYAGLSYAYSVGSDDFFLSPHESMPRASEAAKKALELDDTLPEAHVEMGIVHFWYDFDWSAAEKEFLRAIELRASYAPAHEYYGWYLVCVGRFAEGIVESKRALELDPLSIEINAIVGQNLYLAHRYDEAIDQLRKTLDMEPSYWYARMFLGLSYEARGDLERAVVECQKARMIQTTIPWPLAFLGHVYAISGKKTEARQTLRELQDWSKQSYVPAYNIATVLIGLGERDQALAQLEKAYADRSMLLTYLMVDPELDSLHGDPRFEDLARRVGLRR